jgi:predicted RNA binding protein YcfA (HicA-like mRNA interferase family)
LPVASGDQTIRAFQRLGYQVVRQRGSHVRLHHPTDPVRRPLTVPRHRELGRGLLRKLLRDASLTPEEFSTLLS